LPQAFASQRREDPQMKALKSRITLCVIGVLMAVPSIAFGCPARIGTNKLGDGIMYSCYLVDEDDEYCYYDCYPVSNS
jgi:hypothetical protein